MSILQNLTKESLKQDGIKALGFTMPATSHKWVDSSSPTVTFDNSDLTLSSVDHWLCPFAGILNKTDTADKKIKYSLQKANGDMLNANGALLRLFPQQVLRLKRLLALKFENADAHNPERDNGLCKRQVPAFVFVEDDAAASISQGIADAGSEFGIGGKLSFYDEQGYIIHPLFVVSMVKKLLQLYPALNIDAALSNQLNTMLNSTTSNTVRIVSADGKPYSGDHLEGMTLVEADSGLFSIDAYSGADTTAKGEIKRQAATAADGDFPPEKATQFVVGNITYGRMGQAVLLQKLPDSFGSDTMAHDFFTLKVLKLDEYLKGNPAEDFIGTKRETKPLLRLNEELKFLASGNAIMGKISSIFTGTADEQLVSATAIDTQLLLPANDNEILWPAFPEFTETIPEENNSFPAGVKDQIRTASKANFLSGADHIDVLLELKGIPFGAAIRVFNRVFSDDAVERRGNGAGGVCRTLGAVVAGQALRGELNLLLKDPLGLKRPDGTTTTPQNPVLIFDLMIVLNNGGKRLFGAISIPVLTSPGASPVPANNILNTVAKRGISKSGILGLGNNISVSSLLPFNASLNSALRLQDETGPMRDAARMPTMARRDLLASAKKGGNWQSLLSGGQINGNLHNANQDSGCPGSPGGNETSNSGVYTQNAQLSYDIARLAFRRTNSLYTRLDDLVTDKWNEPAANEPLTEDENAGDTQGTFAGTVLQNIAACCETPELALLKDILTEEDTVLPDTFDELVTSLVGWINDIDTNGLSDPLLAAATRLKNEMVPKLNAFKNNTTLSAAKKERLYDELKRELSAACFGRRDTQWALHHAIKQARHSIYIETPGFSFTEGEDSEDYSANLIADLNAQMQSCPGLRVILCVPEKPDYHRTYDQWIRSEVKERWQILNDLPAEQLVVFHPVGFPGRPSNIEQTTIIIDDQWALTGSSSFRRRGLAFDGSSDLVCTDLQNKNGVSEPINALRIQLLKQRLGVNPEDNSSSRSLLLNDFRSAFATIRQTLVAGGLGKIKRLWNGHTDGVTFSEPTIDRNLANPDGMDFNAFEASLISAFASLAK